MNQSIVPTSDTIITRQALSPQTLSPDLISLLLDDKRSPQTRRAYAADLAQFFRAATGQESTPESVKAFLAQSTPEIALCLAQYKSQMRGAALSEATINRRLAAIKSLLKFAHRLGHCGTDGRGLVDGERVQSYRDTRGVDVKTLKKLLAAPASISVRTSKNINFAVNYPTRARQEKCLRDTAILTLLIENALRRAELCALDVNDFEETTCSLWILGKGKGTQKERVTLSARCSAAIAAYLRALGGFEPATPGNGSGQALFRNLDHRPDHAGQRLTPDGLYALVQEYGRLVGLKRLTPHMLRHSSITAALDATKGDVRRVQKLSRHAVLATLQKYDDSRADFQGEVSSLLSGLLHK